MMMMKKKKQSRSQSSTEKKTLEPKLSKLPNGKDSKHMIKGMSSKPAQELSSSQSRVVRCPKCHKYLQEPVDVTIYKCSGCNTILQAKRWELENNDNSIHRQDLLCSSQNRSLTPVRSSYRKYSSRKSPSVETAYRRRHETSYIPREWIRRRADEFSVTGDSASARSCSGVVKLSITKKEDTITLLDLLRFVEDSGTSISEKTVIHSHRSCSDKGAGDRANAVNLETFEEKGNKERDTRRSISSEFYELKLEAFQPSLNHKLREEQKAASRIHLEEECGSKSPVRSSYRKYSSRPSPLFERRYETSSSYIRREWITTSASPSPSSYGYTSPFHWSREFSSSSSAAASPIRFQGETSDQKYFHWSQMHDDSQLSITKKEDTTLLDVDSGTSFAEETHQDDSASESQLLSSSEKGSGDRVDAVMLKTFEDKGINENIRSISSKFIDLTFQPQWNHKSRAQASLLGDGSGEVLVYKKERMSTETEIVADRLVSLNKKEHVCETNLLSENTHLGEVKWEDILGELLLEKSGESSISDSSKFIDLKLEPCPNHTEDTNSLLAKEKQSFIGERWAETMEDRAGLHLEEYETNYENYTNPFEWSSQGAASTFHVHEYESTTLEETFECSSQGAAPMFCLNDPELLGPDNEEADDGSSESSSTGGSFNSSHEESSKLRAVFHQEEEEEPQVMSDMISVKLQDIFEWTSERAPTFRLYNEPELGELLEPDEAVMAAEDGASLDFEKFENEKLLLEDQRVEPREDIFRLSLDDTLEQEWVTFHSETSQEDKQVSLRQIFKQGDTEENIPASGSMVSSEGHEPRSISAELDSEAEEEILRDPLEYFLKENEMSGQTSEPYAHFNNTTDPSEVVGLRHALYQTQTSPLSSPIHTPIGSSPLHNRTRSPMNSHIVSPLRSPTNSSGSLSDVLFLAKRT